MNEQLRAVLDRDDRAWRRLVADNEATLRGVVAECAETIRTLADHEIDDALGDFWLFLLEDDLRRLRGFAQSGGEDLDAWLRMMAGEFARKHARRLAAEPQFEPLETVRDITPAPPDGYLTTNEAAGFLRFRSPSGIRTAVMRGELQPAGVGPRGSLLFKREDLDRFVRARHARHQGRLARSGRSNDATDALSGNHEDRRKHLSDPRAGERSAHWKAKGGATNKRVHVEGGRGAAVRVAPRGAAIEQGKARTSKAGSIRALVDDYQAAQSEEVDRDRVRKGARQPHHSAVR
jgi:hypothetical protein